MTTTDWKDKVTKKQQSCLEKLPKEWLLPASISKELREPLEEHPNLLLQSDIPRRSGVLSKRELDLTEDFTVKELLTGLKEGSISALELTVAFSKRATLAQQLLSCLTETYFPEAQERARFLDNERAQGRITGPLHGLPISLKDGFQILGSQATIGFVSFLDRVSEKNSPLVDILLELGAVIYVKTNIPQTLMTADSHNNVFGRTLNPHNTSLGAGGSSGGEGALVAFRGSPLGIGTDVAGSIRIPSLCCGTYGFKPTASRIPYGGQSSASRPGGSFILASAGPLANDMEALTIASRVIISANPSLYDSTATEVPWRDLPNPENAPKFTLGLLSEDPTFPLHPPVKRALAEAIKALKAQGHHIVPIPASRAHIADAICLAWTYFGLDATSTGHIKAGGEPAVPSILQIRNEFAKLKSDFCSDIMHLEGIPKLAALNVKRTLLSENWRVIWKEERLDGVIGPAAQGTAVGHDNFGLPPYTTFLNVLDYPACVIPFGTSSRQFDPDPVAMKPGQVGPNYDPSTMAGMPTSVQIFTNKMRDEECLRVSTVIERCLKQYTGSLRVLGKEREEVSLRS